MGLTERSKCFFFFCLCVESEMDHYGESRFLECGVNNKIQLVILSQTKLRWTNHPSLVVTQLQNTERRMWWLPYTALSLTDCQNNICYVGPHAQRVDLITLSSLPLVMTLYKEIHFSFLISSHLHCFYSPESTCSDLLYPDSLKLQHSMQCCFVCVWF